jgi:hypothetical protein
MIINNNFIHRSEFLSAVSRSPDMTSPLHLVAMVSGSGPDHGSKLDKWLCSFDVLGWSGDGPVTSQ